jgi:hypothetical protein
MRETQIQRNMEFHEGVISALRKTPDVFTKEITFLPAAK